MTELTAPAGYSSSDLVFDDNFSGTTLKNWNSYITSNAAKGAAWNSNGSGGSNEGGTYVADYDVPSHVAVDNGLTLTATKQSITAGGKTYPYTGGAVSSYGKFEFDGGYLQIGMQASGGSGAWPALWLLPGQGAGNSGDNFEIDMQEGGMTSAANPDGYFTYHLHNGSAQAGGSVNTGTDLSQGYHTYGIDWDPGKSITYYLDGKKMGEVTSAQMTIPSEPMEVIMNNSMANSNAAGWHSAVNSSSPSSTAMKISDVQLYQKAGSGDKVTGANVAAGSAPSSGGTVGSGTGSTSGSGTVAGSGSTGGSTSAGGSSTGTGSGSVSDPAGGGSSKPSGGGITGNGSSSGTAAKAPTLSVADNSLSVSPGRHNGVDLGIGVSAPKGDNVTVNIKGLPSYETITDKLDHKTFSGGNVTLTAAQVNSGLTLTSSYRGSGDPSSTLTVSATDRTTHATGTPQSIVVKDPPASAGVTEPAGNGGTTSSGTGTGLAGSGKPGSGTPGSAASGSGSSHGGSPSQWGHDVSAWFDSHPGFADRVKTLSEKSSSALSTSATPAAPTGAGERAFALLNQMMAGDFGSSSHFAQSGLGAAAGQHQQISQLARPLH